jgi:hypothetical protein
MTLMRLRRLVALILIPCLVMDPVTVMGSMGPVGAGLVPARNGMPSDGILPNGYRGPAQGRPLQSSFTSQALAERVASMAQPGNPTDPKLIVTADLAGVTSVVKSAAPGASKGGDPVTQQPSLHASVRGPRPQADARIRRESVPHRLRVMQRLQSSIADLQSIAPSHDYIRIGPLLRSVQSTLRNLRYHEPKFEGPSITAASLVGMIRHAKPAVLQAGIEAFAEHTLAMIREHLKAEDPQYAAPAADDETSRVRRGHRTVHLGGSA